MINNKYYMLQIQSDHETNYECIYLELQDSHLKRLDLDGQPPWNVTSEFGLLLSNKFFGFKGHTNDEK